MHQVKIMLKKGPTSRKTQAQQTKKKIYDVSIRLIKKHGFDQVTIADISKKAGVSVGTFYHYFASKADIFNEIFLQGDQYFADVVAGQLASGSAADRILRYFTAYAAFNGTNGIDFVSQLYNTQNKLFIKKDRFMLTLLQDIVTDGQAKGEIVTDQSPEAITNILLIYLRGIIFDWCLHDGSYDLTTAVAELITPVIRAFTCPERAVRANPEQEGPPS